jgi:2',3'-cyclic-nucleotide 2'-phosphodiesterase (5'-nucleotidase family)
MRVQNDVILANEENGIDLILGGHDHHRFSKMVILSSAN